MSLITGPQVVSWVAKRTNEFGNFGASIGIGWQRNGEIIAGVIFCEYNSTNMVCHIASDGSRRWATRTFLWAICHYCYEQVRVKRITVCVGEGNGASRKFVEHFGFTHEATLEGAHPSGDMLVYRLWRRDCRFLRAPYAKPRPDLLRAAA